MVDVTSDSSDRPLPTIQVLGVSLLFVALATAVKIAQEPFSHESSPFLFFGGAVLAATWWGGLRTGVTTTIFSTVSADFFFIGTRYKFVFPTAGAAIPLVLFLGEGVFISLVVSMLQRSNKDRARLLLSEQAARTQIEAHAARLREIARSLRESEARFSSIFKQVANGIAQTDLSGRFLLVNERFCQIVGRPANKLLDARMQDITHPDDLAGNLELFERLVKDGQEFYVENRYVRPDGTFVWVNHSVSAVNDEQGKPQYIVAVVQDITQRKLVDEELAHHRERLEELVIERTDALRKSMEVVRRSERLASIGTLAAGIAHEVNNPLNAILLTAECMLRVHRAHGDPELTEALQTISQEAQRGGRVVQGVLQFAREERSVRAPCDLNAVVQVAVRLARTYASTPAELVVSFELGEGLPLVLANSTELEQVVVNLVKNAIQASQDNVHVVLQTRKVDPDGVELIVKDDGPGIPDAQREHIFDPFFSTRPSSGGFGLGLSLCHRIIEDHGGSILVSGQPGEGTTITVRFPQHDVGQSQSSMISGENI